MKVPIGDIILDPRLQMRAQLNQAAIDDYAEHIDELPPGKIVMSEEGIMWLCDGQHTYHANVKQKRTEMECTVTHGTFLDALALAASSNDKHGIQRTNADKTQTVLRLLAEKYWRDRSDRAVADAAHVSNHLVSKIREIPESGNIPTPKTYDNTKTRTGIDGRQYATSKPPILCDGCKRKGIRRDCPQCERLRNPQKYEDDAPEADDAPPSDTNGEMLCDRCRKEGKKPNCSMCKELREPTPPAPPKPEPDVIPVDAFQNPIPKRCRKAYLDPFMQESIDFIAQLEEKLRLQRLVDGTIKRKGQYPFVNMSDVADGIGFAMQYLDQVLEHLKANRPAGVCPGCKGEGCPDCHMCGMVPRATYETLKAKV